MSMDPPEFLRLSNLRPSHDGTRIAFTIECQDDTSLDISCTVAELTDIISFLVRGAAIASERSDSEPPIPKTGDTMAAVPLPALGLGVAPAPSPEQTYILLHLTGFDLMFSVPSNGLARLAPDLARMASTLSASTSKQ